MDALELGNCDSYFTVCNKDNRSKLFLESKCVNFHLCYLINKKENAVNVTNHTINFMQNKTSIDDHSDPKLHNQQISSEIPLIFSKNINFAFSM